MKRRALAILSAVALTLSSAAMLTACSQELTDEPLNGTVLADFSKGEAETVFASDGWTNEDVFNTFWKDDNVTYENGAMNLSITENPDGSMETNDGYFGGEGRTYQYFGYGDFEVRMKPSGKNGTCSAFFTCTGEYDLDENGDPNPWDEVDIEFLGNDTTQVQFNYYVDGVGGHEKKIDLGFDASEDFHNYGYRWTEDYIVWFVDGKPVYKVEATEKNPLPSTPGRILMNYWCGTEKAEGWMGKFENPDDQCAEYQWIKTSATPIGELPEKVDVEEFTGDWTQIPALETAFESSDAGVYNVTTEGTSANVTYTDVAGDSYKNVKTMTDTVSADKNWLHFTLTNDGEETVNVRVNVRSTSSTINSYGFGNGQLLETKPGDGSFVDVPAGESVEVEIKYEGVANNVELMIDSARATSTTHSGDITVSDFKFAKQGEVVIPEEPESHNDGILINDTNVVFAGDLGLAGYTINTDAETNSMNVTYSAITGASYKNISADITAIASDKNVLSMTVKNNGTETVTLRVDVVSKTQVNANTKVCNLSATQDGAAAETSIEWGGSTFTIAAGATSELEVVYDTSKGPESLQIMMDSSVYGDKATHSGDVTFSAVEFSGEGSVDVPDEPDPDEPEIPADGSALAFTSQLGYTVSSSGVASESVNVTYNGLTQPYANIQADISSYAAGNDTFTVTIANNGDAAVQVRVDIQGTNKVSTDNGSGSDASTDACNVSATCTGGSDLRTDTTWGGTFVTVGAGETITLTITYNGEGAQGAVRNILVYFDSNTDNTEALAAAAGDVTLSGFAFSKAQA